MRFTKTLGLILAFVLLLVFFLHADAAEAEDSQLTGYAGTTTMRGLAPMLGLSITWPEAGPGTTDYELGLMLTGPSEYGGDVDSNATAFGLLIANRGRAYMGIGPAVHNNPLPYHCSPSFALAIGYNFTERASVRVLHFSTGDSCQPNTGRDFVNFGWRF